MQKIAILLPCYNEEKTVGKVITDFRFYFPEADIYVYDNNSTDNSSIIAKKTGAIVIKEPVQGKGNVIRSMFSDIDADIYLMVDTDDTYFAADGYKLVNAIKNGYDIAIGDRLSTSYFTENKRLFHNVGNTFVCKAVNWLFKGQITDLLTGYRAFSRRFVKSYPVLSNGFEVETEMSIHTLDKNLKYMCIPVQYKDRPQDSPSKLRTIPDGIKVIKMILKMIKTYKPLLYFGTIAAVLSVVASLFLFPVLYQYYITGLVEKFPTLIVCGFAYITSIQLIGTGLVLNSANYHNKQNFEIEYKNISRTV